MRAMPSWMPSCRLRPVAFFVPAALAGLAPRRLVSYVVAIWVVFHDGQHRVVATVRRGLAVSGPRKDGRPQQRGAKGRQHRARSCSGATSRSPGKIPPPCLGLPGASLGAGERWLGSLSELGRR